MYQTTRRRAREIVRDKDILIFLPSDDDIVEDSGRIYM
jgi:hypothetical protein